MKFLFVILALSFSIQSFATPKNTKYCIKGAEKSVISFLDEVRGEYKKYDVKRETNVKSYRVVKNPRFNLQMHEDYTIIVKTKHKDYIKGMEYQFKVQMFASQYDPDDKFTCSINKFNMHSVEEGVDF